MSAEKVATFQERFSDLVSSCGKSQTAIATDVGVVKQTISAWITGQSSPRSPMITALADYFDVSVAWLMGFDVPKRQDKELYAAYEKEVFKYITLTEKERQLLDAFNSADDRAQADALDMLLKHSKRPQYEKEAT